MKHTIRKKLIFLFATLLVPFAIPTAMATPETTLRILSYNIHHGEGLDGKIDLKRIAGIIKSVSPDVVSLQEVDQGTQRSGKVNQAGELARLTGMNFVYGSSMNYQGGKYGNAVLTKLAITNSKVIPLPGEPRSALCVTLKLPGDSPSRGEFLFIATHLDTSQAPRLASLPLIEKIAASRKDRLTILAGDLNATPQSPAMLALHKTWMNATSRKDLLTSPANRPRNQIDYILYRPSSSGHTLETSVLDEPVASDHRPVLAVLQIQPPSQKTPPLKDQREQPNSPKQALPMHGLNRQRG